MEIYMTQKDWVTILKSAITVLILFIICKFLKNIFDYFYNHVYFKPCNMSTVNCSPILLYISSFLSLYKHSTSTSPILYLLQEALLGGCCYIFEKERIFKLYLGMKPGIIFYKPETVEAVLSNSTLIEKSVHYKFLESWLGKGLFTSPGDKWRRRRKQLTPTFHFSILEDFIPVVQEQSNVLVSKLQTFTKEPWVDIVPLAILCTLDTICQTAMGIRMNAQLNQNEDYVQAVHEMASAIGNRVIRPWLYPDIIFYRTSEGKRYKANLQRVHGTTRKVIKEKKAEILALDQTKQEAGSIDNSQGKQRKAFLELLLKYHLSDPSFTEANIKEEVDTFMFGGHDTTGMGLSLILYCIGLYPEIQKKIVEELDDIFQNDRNREVTREDLTEMKYLECVIKETFRLYPPAPFFLRECTETFEILGHKVYEGSFCVIFPFALHRDRESFPDPEKFIPERFFPENSRERHPYSYIPFSAGPRNCIGQKFAMMELKIIVASVLRHFRISSLDPRDVMLFTPNLVLRNTKPLRLRLELR